MDNSRKAPEDKLSSSHKFGRGSQSLQTPYLKRLTAQIIELDRLRDLLRSGAAPQADIQKLMQTTHNLAGSGGTFGFPEISNSARDLHNAVKNHSATGENTPQAMASLSEIIEKITALERACRDAVDGVERENTNEPDAEESGDAAQIAAKSNKSIAILARQSDPASAMAEQLKCFSYAVTLETDLESFGEKYETGSPFQSLVIYSDLPPEDITAIQSIIRSLSEGRDANGDKKKPPGLILVSSLDDYDTRLSAIRLGVEGFFTLGIDVLKIVDKIEQLAMGQAAQPSANVLIIDDEVMLMEFYSDVLQHAGMRVTMLSDPKDCLKAIASQSFDLVMIDYEMPYCNGQELAAIIRQHENYLSMPIIFISAREDIETLLIDTGLGIDDFLVKPFKPGHLISVVRSRTRRASDLRALTVRDSFTGLLNHAHFLEMLTAENFRANRTGKSAAYAMIDIDHFKKINDTYGHGVGDQVIKRLARMLQQHLRRSDIIGRCGGEEFGIVMPNCSFEKALEILEALRQKFSDVSYKIGDHDINVTFSGGVIEISPDAQNVNNLIRLADVALYKAKTQGRNQLVTAK